MVSYEFYTDTYHGSGISAEDWPELEARAAAKLARYKRTYIVTAPSENAEAMAVCAMADAMAYFTAVQNGSGGNVASASIGSVSVSYGSASSGIDMSQRGQEKELYRCAAEYLSIYRGIRSCWR